MPEAGTLLPPAVDGETRQMLLLVRFAARRAVISSAQSRHVEVEIEIRQRRDVCCQRRRHCAKICQRRHMIIRDSSVTPCLYALFLRRQRRHRF